MPHEGHLTGGVELPQEERTPFVVNLTAREREVLVELAFEADISEERSLIMALRLYQARARPVDLGPKLHPRFHTEGDASSGTKTLPVDRTTAAGALRANVGDVRFEKADAPDIRCLEPVLMQQLAESLVTS